MSKGNPPVKKFKIRKVEVCVWAKESEDGFVKYSITAQKSWRDKDTGEYNNSTSFFPEEAAVAATLIGQALGWISEQRAQKSATKVFTAEDQKDPFERTT